MNMVSIASGAGITVAMGTMRDRGIGFGVAFTICAAITALAGGLILLVRPRERLGVEVGVISMRAPGANS